MCQQNERRDPDPIVVDLLVNLAAAGIGGVIVKLGQAAWAGRPRWPRQNPPVIRADLDRLRHSIDTLDRLADDASRLVEPGTKRELGGKLLLPQDQLRRYHQIREALFEEVRTVDTISESLIPSNVEGLARGRSTRRRSLPQDFRTQSAFLEKRLRDARVASTSERSFLEIKAAIGTMRRMLEQVELAVEQ
jgi:hypothetical protein